MEDKISFESFVLAGGKSSRMGTDKGLMDFHGRKMIEHVLNALRFSPRITIISENDNYKHFGYPVISDIHKNCGPLGGIHSGLSNSNSDWCIAVGCDLPFITSDFFDFLLKKINGVFSNAIVPVHDNNIEPLCALYHKSCLQKIEELILKKEYKMHTVLGNLNTRYIEVPKEFGSEKLFKNLNWPADISD